jgi:hypothetical protein
MPQDPNFLEMLTYMRPEGSRSQRKFCNRYLLPVFGQPDAHGNYIKIVGDKPSIAFMAHHDTVHRESGRQKVEVRNDKIAYTVNGSCLGADCTSGIFLILKMISANVPGVYVVHAGEEIGCVGSRALVKDFPDWLDHVDAAISFDRKGYTSVITHQMGARTCSNAFADSLIEQLGSFYCIDKGGVYTDSNEYIDIVPECTNISVGYFAQHTKSETQDIQFLERLANILIKADWSKLVIARNPSVVEYDNVVYPNHFSRGWESMDDYLDTYVGPEYEVDTVDDTLVDVIKRYPEEVAAILMSYGYSAAGLLDDCDDIAVKSRKSFGRVPINY